ncbi:hypothetical protein TRFO_27912 [Tritrichomonas foetus]|uniref:Tubby C-terminal domain-containing protein n=1 Tax=Tritrichomonas foetus TaxID=1144522 RepID=A0A1J4K1C3_9EUKA|nr:hypothetical protein TRFO_27912 [Tritrichomonas foetus]|eukprot:OHT04584.1 hypothetical protein TRFO_27912 [Tritrichomonas foetus]
MNNTVHFDIEKIDKIFISHRFHLEMRGKQGANLFTIEFSSSDGYYEEEDYDESTPPPPPPPKKVFRQMTPTRVTKRQVTVPPPAIGGLIELSSSEDEYYSSTIKSSSQTTQESTDIFTLKDEDSKTNNSKKPQVDFSPKSNTNIKKPNNNINSQTANNNDKINDIDNSKNEDNNYEITEIKDETVVQVVKSTPVQRPRPTPIPQKIEHKNWPTYLITRDSKMHFNGRRLFFSFFDGSNQLYAAKCKSKNAESVFIMKGTKVHLGETADALVLVGNDSSDFSLRKNTNVDDEIMTIRIIPPKTPADTARKLTVSFFSPKDGTPARLTSKNPKLNPDGKVEHDFEGHFAVSSTKNAVLVAKANGPSMLLIRKTGPDAIEIETRFEHEDLWIFTIGIASFLSKVK